MNTQSISVGVSFPTTEIGIDAAEIRDFAQAVEDMGYGYMVAYDRLLAVNPANRPDWSTISPYTHESTFQEPLMLFSHLAAVTRRIRLVTSVIVLPQRQTLLFAKQAANLDRYCEGRLTLGIGIGQNPVEYAAMDVPYRTRTARMEEQIAFLRRFWTEPCFSASGSGHEIVEAGINPLPIQQPIPLWIGTHAPAGVERAARIADGLMCYVGASQAAETIASFRASVIRHGRDPERVRVANCILAPVVGAGSKPAPDALAAEVKAWEIAGAREVHIHTMDVGLRGATQHIDYMRRIAEALR
jgi:probable F420-dependent oxidoreductase